MATYPMFCLFRHDATEEDPIFARIATEFGLGGWHPGVVTAEEEGLLRVVVTADGHTALLEPTHVRMNVSEEIGLALMDAVEEAIEDARDQGDLQTGRVARFEQVLALLERAFDDID
jgi:hypothetical protein